MTETRYSAMPTVTDDVTKGYSVGDIWEDQSNGVMYECTSSKVGVAEWKVVSVRMSVKSIVVTNTTSATGTVTVTGAPTADQTLTVGTEVFIFKATSTSDNEIEISAVPATLAASIVSAINKACSDVTASNTEGVITITAVHTGIAGNSILLSETATNIAVSGAHLTNGVNGTPGHLHELIYYDGKLYVSTKEDYTITNDGWLSTTLA